MVTAAELTILLKAQNQTTSAIRGLQADLTGLSASLKNVGAIAGGNLLAKLTQDTFGFGKSVIDVGFGFNAMKEQAEIAFTTMLGSGQRAKGFLDQLQAFAAKTPFEFPELVTASQRMLAMGFNATEILPTLTSIGDAVAAMGGSSESIDRVTRALGQMQAKGKTSAEEMLQLTEAGIPAWRYLAEAIGESIPVAMKKVEQGAVGARTTIKAVTDGINQEFGGMMAKQATTFNGMLSTLKDTFNQAAGTVLRPFFDLAKDFMDDLIRKTDDPALDNNLREISIRFLDVAASIYDVGLQLDSMKDKILLLLTPFKLVADAGTATGELIRGALGLPGPVAQGPVDVRNPFAVKAFEMRQEPDAAATPKFAWQRMQEELAGVTPKIDSFGDGLVAAAEKVGSLSDAISQAISGIFGRPTREEAALDLSIAKGSRSLSKLKASGIGGIAGSESARFVESQERQLEQLRSRRDVMQSDNEIQRLRLQLADKTLLTEEEQNRAFQELLGTLDDVNPTLAATEGYMRALNKAISDFIASLTRQPGAVSGSDLSLARIAG